MEKKTKKRKGIVITVVVLVVAALVIFALLPMLTAKETEYKTHTVERGSISVEAMAQGYAVASQTCNKDIPDGIIVEEILVKTGESVDESTPLASVDIDSVETLYHSLELQLASIDSELLSLSFANADTKTITAPVSGRVKVINCVEGDDVVNVTTSNGTLIVLSTDGFMRVEPNDPDKLQLGTEIEVRVGDDTYEAELRRGDESRISVLVDDRYIGAGDEVIICDKDGNTITTGVAVINAPLNITWGEGKVDKIYVELNDKVNAGSGLIKVTGVDAAVYALKYAEREACAEDLAEAAALLADPHIYADIKGVVRAINVSEDMMYVNGGMPAFIIAEQDSVVIDVTVDELDIDSIETGQIARVTMAALDGCEFSAKVTFVSSMGNAQTGFMLRLEFDETDERILEGMYADAYITTASVKDAIVIPLEIVKEDTDGVYVYVQDGDDRVKTYIELGLSDGMRAEVLDGLELGDVVSYEQSDMFLNGMMRFFMQGVEAQPTDEILPETTGEE